MNKLNIAGQPIAREAVLKATALQYLKEALFAEKFEECVELVQSAKNHGAEQSDISEIIALYLSRSKRIRL